MVGPEHGVRVSSTEFSMFSILNYTVPLSSLSVSRTSFSPTHFSIHSLPAASTLWCEYPSHLPDNRPRVCGGVFVAWRGVACRPWWCLSASELRSENNRASAVWCGLRLEHAALSFHLEKTRLQRGAQVTQPGHKHVG